MKTKSSYWLVRPSLSSKTWHTYVLPWSYKVPDTLAITGLIAETTLFGYKVFKGTLSGLTQYLFGDWKSLLMKNWKIDESSFHFQDIWTFADFLIMQKTAWCEGSGWFSKFMMYQSG